MRNRTMISAGRVRMLALLPLVASTACIEVDPPLPPPPVDPVLGFAMWPATLSPDELIVEQGDVIAVLGAIPPGVAWNHRVSFADHYLIQCSVDDEEHDYWPPCSLAVAEGYVMIEDEVGQRLGFGCTARVQYVPGGAINATFSHCATLIGHTSDQGPGVEWSGVWTVTGCDPTWITRRHPQSFDTPPDDSPAIPALTDTTRITVAQPCESG